MKRIICLILIVSLCTGLSACARDNHEDLMVTVNPSKIIKMTELNSDSASVADFGLRLFRESMKSGENTLISPLSVLCALAMTANGAREETRSQMEAVLGLDVETLNSWLSTYMSRLELSENKKLHLANSIWFKDVDSFTVNPDFLQLNADYYGAGVMKAPFDDTTCREINDWVAENTDGMIRDILDGIPDSVVMYLVNALAFDANWQEIYRETAIWDGEFTMEDGISQNVQMMHSTENTYLEDDLARGFIKYYEGGEYAFAALIPNQGISVEAYLDSLTGERLLSLLKNAQNSTVQAAMPKFELEYNMELSEVLCAMGMERAFDGGLADFTGLGTSTEGNIYISRVLHKTFIRVDGKGTKAGAATVVEMDRECAMEPMEVHVVNLDRPFVYLLIDTHTNLPFFMGTMMDPGGEILPEPELEKAPDLTVRWGNEEMVIGTGNCSWRGPAVNGQIMEYIACGSHPLDNSHALEFKAVEGDQITLSFPVAPDEIRVLRWNVDDLGNMDAQAQQVTPDHLVIPVEPGAWIYEVTAKWQRDTWGGEASYALYLERSHIHETAKTVQTVADPVTGYCGNTQTTVHRDGNDITFSGEDSVELTDILINLDYDPLRICRCRTEFTVDTEFRTGIEVNLSQAFARCERGQADLTAEQIRIIREILDRI